MCIPHQASATPKANGSDSALAEWAEELAARIQAGEPVDLSDLAREAPERAEELRRLLPAIELMAEFGRSAATGSFVGAGSSSPGPIPAYEHQVLGDFRIVREVGRGGMGIVYEAEQLSLGRRVALKILPFAAALDPRQLQRFQLEAQAAACLHHTNIVPVHAVGSERGVPFYAMQFIDGRTLAQVIGELRRLDGLDQADAPGRPTREPTAPDADAPTIDLSSAQARPVAPFPPARTGAPTPPPGASDPLPAGSSTRDRAYIRTMAALGLQAAEALDHAHSRGILHRDIKPANLMLDAAGHLWLTDFGLAQIQGDHGLTLSGDILGTLRYMSPEQAMARRVVIDGRTDVYSLGVTLYELLTLRPAIDGRDRAEILRRVAQENPVPPRRVNPALPRDLETIILKAIEKDPVGRYQTAADLAGDLRRFLEDRPIVARRVSLPGVAWRWCKRNRAVAALLLVVQLMLALGLAASLLAAGMLRQRVIEAERRLKESEFWNRMFYQTSPLSTQGGSLDADQILTFAEEEVADRTRNLVADPVVEARVRLGLGTIFRQRGETDRASPHLLRARDLFERHLGPDHIDALWARIEFSWVLQKKNRAFGIGEVRNILARARRVLPPDGPEVLGMEIRLAEALLGPDHKEAVRILEQTVERSRRVLEPEHWVTLLGLQYLAVHSAYWEGDFDRAIAMLTPLRGAMARSLGPRNVKTLSVSLDLGRVRFARGDLPGALKEYQVVREGFRLVHKEGNWRATVPEEFECDWVPILVLRALGEDRAAAVALDEGIARWTRAKGERHDSVVVMKALRDLDRGDFEAARPALDDLWRRREALGSPAGPVDIGRAYAEALAGSGDHERAIEVARGVLAYAEDRMAHGDYTERHYDVAVARDLMAALLAAAPETSPAPRGVLRALDLAERNVAHFRHDGRFLTTLGLAQYRAGRWQESIASLEEADRIEEERRPAPRGFVLAMAYWRAGQEAEALCQFRQSAAWMDEQRPGHRALIPARGEAATVLGLADTMVIPELPPDPFAR